MLTDTYLILKLIEIYVHVGIPQLLQIYLISAISSHYRVPSNLATFRYQKMGFTIVVGWYENTKIVFVNDLHLKSR